MNIIYESDIIDNLRKTGINVLTGEACAYSMRLLCDVKNQNALDLIQDYLSSKVELSASWNSGIGSIMLSRAILIDLFIFSLLRAALCVVVYYDMSSISCNNQYRVYSSYGERDDNIADYPYLRDCARRTWSNISSHPHSGSRNLHAFTGRYT